MIPNMITCKYQYKSNLEDQDFHSQLYHSVSILLYAVIIRFTKRCLTTSLSSK